MNDLKFTYEVIAAIRKSEEFNKVILSDCDIIFDLNPDIFMIKSRADASHKNNKLYFIHLDLTTGIGKDKNGILFAKRLGTDGIISTRVNLIKTAREAELITVQRFFIVDSHSIETTIDAVKTSKPHMIEIMPGIIPKAITRIKSQLDTTLIAGGIIDTRSEVESIIMSGAAAVSSGNESLWHRQ